jgi:hypothetical protein
VALWADVFLKTVFTQSGPKADVGQRSNDLCLNSSSALFSNLELPAYPRCLVTLANCVVRRMNLSLVTS